jgi:N-methylhydantoinase B/oxoprolinase/acetone carboxylase alpha subunit
VICDEVTVSTLFDRMTDGPYGLWGGNAGAPCGIFVCPAGEVEFRTAVELFGTVSPSKFVNIRLKRGDRILVHSPGGGGFGAPEERADAALKQDIEDGFVSVAGLQAYGRG